MNRQVIEKLLQQVVEQAISPQEAVKKLEGYSFEDLYHTKLDTHRSWRKGIPEVIYGAGKSHEQIRDIAQAMAQRQENILITRAEELTYTEVRSVLPKAEYFPVGKIIRLMRKPAPPSEKFIAVVTAGTSDYKVAEEAKVTAEFMGCQVKEILDVGVAGIHRLFASLETLRQASVIIVVAGMEGALPGVVSGLLDKPVIGVPTSVGYGANLEGLTACLSMLTACSSGLSVVNIDNGFGAAYQAALIMKMIE